MKLFRKINKNSISKFCIPALAVLFVFSLSIHNHSKAGSSANNLDTNPAQSHSVEDCSACLLQGNLQVPETEYSFDNNQLELLLAFISIDFTVPHSFLNLDEPSRSPPTL